MIVHGRKVEAAPVLIRLNDESTTSAFRLNVYTSPLSSAVWELTEPNNLALHGVSSAYWIANQATFAGHRLRNPAEEAAAEQMAIWSYTNQIKITKNTIPSKKLRIRAEQLYKLAPSRGEAPKTYGAALNSFVRYATANKVAVEVQVIPYPINVGVLTHAQSINIGLNGEVATIHTSKDTQLTIEPSGALQRQEVGTAPNNDVAFVELPRPTYTEPLQVTWRNLDFKPGQVFVALDGGRAPQQLITNRTFAISLDQTLILDPRTFPNVQGLIQGWFISRLAHLNSWQDFVILAIWLLITLLGAQSALHLARTVWDKTRSRKKVATARAHAENDSHPAASDLHPDVSKRTKPDNTRNS